MGNSQSIDFKKFENRQLLESFIKRNDQNIDDLQERQKKLLELAKNRNPSKSLERAVNNYYESETVCNVPPMINWMFPSQREKCKIAKTNFVISTTEFVNEFITDIDLQKMMNETQINLDLLHKLKENKKYLEPGEK